MDIIKKKVKKRKIKRIILITNIPNPYRIPLFNELNRQLEKKQIKLKIIFGAKGYKRRKFILNINDCKFEYRILNSLKINFGNSEKTFFTYKGLLKTLRQEQPDKIIIIGFSFGTLKLWIRSFWNKTPIIIWSGSIITKGRKDSFLRRIYRKILIRRAYGFIAYGTKAKEYLINLGADPEKIFIAINTVDTSFFFEKTLKKRKELKNIFKNKHLTFIGYLVPRKGVKQILKIISLLKQQKKDFILEIIGDGSDREKLEEYTKKNNISEFVSFLGFKQKEELPEYLARSDCFLFQTNFDIWGLVLNEAMAAGVPCISSIHAGATHDLIIEGETGFAMDFSKTEKIVERVNWILDHPDKARIIGENASKFIQQNVSISKSCEGFLQAIGR
jgi:glycosyltransferase involved in cell wall biosynthesis